jgi:hypothetical protein
MTLMSKARSLTSISLEGQIRTQNVVKPKVLTITRSVLSHVLLLVRGTILTEMPEQKIRLPAG